MEDAALQSSNAINALVCAQLGVQDKFLKEWTDGVVLHGAELAEDFWMEDYPNVQDNIEVAAKEIDRISDLQKIFWYPTGQYPPDLSVCPSNLILKGSRPRVVHDWSRVGLNKHLTIPEVNYGTMDQLVANITQGAYLAGLDFQDSFLHWPIHPSSRRKLGVRHPLTKRIGVFLYLPFGLGPAPGINDANIGEVVRVVVNSVGDVIVVTFVDDLRLLNTPGTYESPEEDYTMLAYKLSEFKETCETMGFRIHSKPGKLIWPTRQIDWIGWLVDTDNMKVTMTESKSLKGMTLCQEMLYLLRSGRSPSAKEAMSLWGFLNFVANVIRQAQPYTRELGRCIVKAEVFQAWGQGRKRFNPRLDLSDLARQDICWWGRLFMSKPHRAIHRVGEVSFLWHRKLPNLDTIWRLAWADGILVVVGLDASSKIGWGITIGDHFAQGKWIGEDVDRHINWKELKAYEHALDTFPLLLANKILYVKADNTAALHYINVGRGRIQELSDMAKAIRLKEVNLGIEAVAIHLPGILNVTPDALSRYYIDNVFRDKHQHRTIRKRLFRALSNKFGPFTLDGMTADDGHNVLLDAFCTPSNPLFEEDLEGHCVWAFPPMELIGPTLKFLLDQLKLGRSFSFTMLVPEKQTMSWFRLLAHCQRLESYRIGSDLFRELRDGKFIALPKIKEQWIVIAQGR